MTITKIGYGTGIYTGLNVEENKSVNNIGSTYNNGEPSVFGPGLRSLGKSVYVLEMGKVELTLQQLHDNIWTRRA